MVCVCSPRSSEKRVSAKDKLPQLACQQCSPGVCCVIPCLMQFQNGIRSSCSRRQNHHNQKRVQRKETDNMPGLNLIASLLNS